MKKVIKSGNSKSVVMSWIVGLGASWFYGLGLCVDLYFLLFGILAFVGESNTVAKVIAAILGPFAASALFRHIGFVVNRKRSK